MLLLSRYSHLNIKNIFLKKRILGGLLCFSAIIITYIFFWSWDWFIPQLNTRLSALLCRKVSIEHLSVSPGLTTTIRMKGVKIAQPDIFSDAENNFAEVKEASLSFNTIDYFIFKTFNFSKITIDHPDIDLITLKNNINNYTFTSPGKTRKEELFTLLRNGQIYITSGILHFTHDPMQTDVIARIESTPGAADEQGFLRINATGRYAQHPITLSFTGGSILTALDEHTAYPIRLTVQNGSTALSVTGQIDQPLTFIGAQLRFKLTGADMSRLASITGWPAPQTPGYVLTGTLDYSPERIIFKNLSGKTGESDISGTVQITPHTSPLFIDASLFSRNMNSNDLTGFYDSNNQSLPLHDNTNNQVLSDTPVNIPKLYNVNAHILFQGVHLQNDRLPLDNIDTELSVSNGNIAVRHLNFKIGNGTIASSASLRPQGDEFKAAARIDFNQLDIARLTRTNIASHAQGIMGGHITLTSEGNSIATLIAGGSGNLTLVLDRGENITAFLPDILGMRLTNAVLSAIGNPSNTELRCLIADMPLRKGIFTTKAFFLATSKIKTFGNGIIDFRNNTLDYYLTTHEQDIKDNRTAQSFHITGSIKNPQITAHINGVSQAAATSALRNIFPLIQFRPAARQQIFTPGLHEENTLLKTEIINNLAAAVGLKFALSSGNRAFHPELNNSSLCNEAMAYSSSFSQASSFNSDTAKQSVNASEKSAHPDIPQQTPASTTNNYPKLLPAKAKKSNKHSVLSDRAAEIRAIWAEKLKQPQEEDENIKLP